MTPDTPTTHTMPTTHAMTAAALMRLLQLTDSAFPAGAFSFSCGLETAAAVGLVRTAADLEAFAHDVARQSALTDGVLALHALRHYRAGSIGGLCACDEEVLLRKLSDEARRMTCRMGRKTAEVGRRLVNDPLLEEWFERIAAERTAGTLPVAQGILFGACGAAERELFCGHLFGVVNTVVSAALRCLRVSHFDTQRILFRAAGLAEELYGAAREMTPDECCAFYPQTDILAALHERGAERLFMN